VMTITSAGYLGVGTLSPQGPIDLTGTASAASLSIRVQNLATDGASAIQALEANGNYCFFGYGGSTRGDNLQDRGFIYSQNGGFNCSVAGDNVIEFTVNGIATSNRLLCMQVGKMGFFGTSPQSQQTSGGNVTNNVTSGGTTDTIADITDQVIYANDAANIRNDIYQLARKVKQINDGLRVYGMLT
jgi:hypothetical protein